MGGFIPGTVVEITAEWLEGEFRSEGVIGGTDRISGITVDELGEGVGMLGDLARVAIEYAAGRRRTGERGGQAADRR